MDRHPQNTSPTASTVEGMRSTTPVATNAVITGMPTIRPSATRMSEIQPKKASGLYSLNRLAMALSTFAPSPKVDSFE